MSTTARSSPSGLSIAQAATEYLAVATAANTRFKALTLYSSSPLPANATPDLAAHRADEMAAKEILLDTKTKLALIRWPDAVASRAATLLTSLDTAVSLIDEDPNGTTFAVLEYWLDQKVADAANALRADIGLPANMKFSGSLL